MKCPKVWPGSFLELEDEEEDESVRYENDK